MAWTRPRHRPRERRRIKFSALVFAHRSEVWLDYPIVLFLIVSELGKTCPPVTGVDDIHPLRTFDSREIAKFQFACPNLALCNGDRTDC